MLRSNRHGCRYHEFTSSGNRFLSLENDVLKLTFWLNKGADLIEIRHKAKDIDVLWRSPTPMPAAGTYISPANPAPGSFFDYYPGGWQEVFPNAHTPTNEYKRAPLGLHGEVCLLRWDYAVLEHSEDCLSIVLSVSTVRTPFHLEKKVTLRRGLPFFVFDERVTNNGNEEMHYTWGHHPVFGAPFVQKGCVIDTPKKSVAVVPESKTPNCRFAGGTYESWPQLQTIQGGMEDASVILDEHYGTADTYYVRPTAGWAALRNPELDLGVGLVWDLAAFPYLWMWHCYSGNHGYPFYSRNYNIGLEPYSVPIQALHEAVKDGNATVIAAGHSHSTRLLFTFTQGKQQINGISTDGHVMV
jgi:hypothetical protein